MLLHSIIRAIARESKHKSVCFARTCHKAQAHLILTEIEEGEAAQELPTSALCIQLLELMQDSAPNMQLF
jgi:hypothetical protein